MFKHTNTLQTSATVALFALLFASGCEYDEGQGDDEVGASMGNDSDSGNGDDACNSDADCDFLSPICDPREQVCGPCTSDSQCQNPNYPSCIEGVCSKICERDEYDPANDILGGAVALGSSADLQLWLCPGEDIDDWFEFSVDQPAYLSIITNNDSLDGDFNLFLLDEQSNEIDSSKSILYGASLPRSVEAIHRRVDQAGTYRIRVQASAGSGGIPYRLQLQTFAESP